MFNEFIIDSKKLIKNIKQAKQKSNNKKICAMVKADAYGIGAKTVVKLLNDYVDYFGVACFFEANSIKRYTNKKILIVGPVERKRIDERFSYTCNGIEDLKYIASKNKNVSIHLKVNSGMNRYGIKNLKEFIVCLQFIKTNKLKLEGVFTHFATSDKYTNLQYKKFLKFVRATKELNLDPIFHCDNSETSFSFYHKMDMIRIGHCLYLGGNGFELIAKINSPIVQINEIKKNEQVGYDNRFIAKKNMRIAVLPVGYADGFSLNNIGKNLLIKNNQCQILNICMDCFMLDITNTNLKINDKIEILNNINNLQFYAKNSSTIDYEIMCRFSLMRSKKIIKY